ncbi:hypothetical protein JCM10908_000253 [Rhodotorula pacifica]|uniref:uncharacterized protein n=1 Tax=Rhodotorula pacifica TaxID=1495444 RepID=UPI0031794BE8
MRQRRPSSYAQFKLAHDRISHTLDELENLYLRPFRSQAEKRARERRDDPARREWREEAIAADEARRGEQAAQQARMGTLVFDGEQPTLLQVRPEELAKAKLVRKRRQALEWATPPPPAARPERPSRKRLIRHDSQPEIPSRLDMVSETPRIAIGDSLPKVSTRSSLRTSDPLGTDAHNRLEQAKGRRQPRVYTVPSAKGKGKRRVAEEGGEATYQHLRRTTSELFSPVEPLDIAAASRTDASLHLSPGFDDSEVVAIVSPAGRRSSRPRTAAVSPFSSRSTLESAGETLAPASSANSLQQASSNEVSPRLASARIPPSLSALTSTRKSFVTSGAVELTPLEGAAEIFSLAHDVPQRPYSAAERTVGPAPVSTTGGRPTPPTSVLPARRTDDLPFLGAQPSFSALPPVPPLPFDFAPSYGSLHAQYSHTRSSYVAEPISSVRTRTSATAPARGPSTTTNADPFAASSSQSAQNGPSSSSGRRYSADAAAPSSSPGWGVSFAPPRGSETSRPSQTSRTSTAGSSMYASGPPRGQMEQDVLRRFSATAHEEDLDASFYPPLSQETVLDSQETGEDMSVDEQEGGAMPPVQLGGSGRGGEADSTAEDTQDSQFSQDP